MFGFSAAAGLREALEQAREREQAQQRAEQALRAELARPAKSHKSLVLHGTHSYTPLVSQVVRYLQVLVTLSSKMLRLGLYTVYSTRS